MEVKGAESMVKRYGVLTVFIFIHIMAGSLVGSFFPPGPWLEQLVKPPFYPPAIVFPVVWTLLYASMGVSLWVFWLVDGSDKGQGYLWYSAQLVVNLLFTPLMFGLQSTMLGSLDTLILVLFLGKTITLFYRFSPKAACILLPYFLWTCFASVLAISLWVLNG
ncbi:MAG TPA: hypothetical protein DEB70_04970 [Planctomycetaceae bacterium]|nr:hypothetical protein [Planctomycetaceae bacterium]|tara:strand:- start:566 stop:1054 length:489 start_codon:yes stop_codon:yes gene_type:complete